MVALRKESVDRNIGPLIFKHQPRRSLSARRAWIEIIMFVNLRVVDGSLSARRAWIEIKHRCLPEYTQTVALRKESVDRNTYTRTQSASLSEVALRKESVDRNSIQLERWESQTESLSARRAWIEMMLDA